MGEEQVSDKLKDLILHCKKMEEEERTAALPYTKAPLLRWSLPGANPCPQLGQGGYTARREATLPRALGNSMDCFPYLWYMALPCSFSDTHSSNSSSNTRNQKLCQASTLTKLCKRASCYFLLWLQVWRLTIPDIFRCFTFFSNLSAQNNFQNYFWK